MRTEQLNGNQLRSIRQAAVSIQRNGPFFDKYSKIFKNFLKFSKISKNDIVKKYFPFDSQNCTLKFGSWSFSADEQVLLPTADNETLRYVAVKMGQPVGVWQTRLSNLDHRV